MISTTFTKPWKHESRKITFSSKFILNKKNKTMKTEKKQSSVFEENCVVCVENFLYIPEIQKEGSTKIKITVYNTGDFPGCTQVWQWEDLRAGKQTTTRRDDCFQGTARRLLSLYVLLRIQCFVRPDDAILPFKSHRNFKCNSRGES